MSDQSSNKDEASAERSPWSRPSVLLSGAFLLALVLLGVVVAVIGGGSDWRLPDDKTDDGRPPGPYFNDGDLKAAAAFRPAADGSVE